MPNSRTSFDHSSFAPKSRKKAKDDGREFAFGKANKEGEKRFQEGEKGRKGEGEKKYDFSDNSVESKIFGGNQSENKSDSLINSPSPPLPFSPSQNVSPSQNERRSRKKERKIEEWLLRRGHGITFALLFAFTFVLYFRPYELIPSLADFSSIALILAVSTILVFVPSQLAAENSLTARPPEVNYVLLLTFFGLITIPIARDPALAWSAFYDPFIKVVLMFIVMVNVVRTEKRLKILIWLALAAGVMLAINGIQNYARGNLAIEDYRAMADIKGMFGNPNAQAMHLVSITPIVVAFGLAARNLLVRAVYFGLAALFVGGNMVTFSRGGFLALIFAAMVLAWKLGRKKRLQVMAVMAVASVIFIAVAPGNYGIRILSIFIPGLDPVGSSSQRQSLLWTSIIVTLRNPWGIGMNNFMLANPFGLLTHNSFTQVSSEMGVAALYCYVMLIFEPIRRLFRMERELEERGDRNWIYYLTIGLQAGLAGYCVASFFDAAAYQWFLYYLVAYAVCLRRVYQKVQSLKSKVQSPNTNLDFAS